MIIIIDYGLGNLHSVYKAFDRLGIETKISNKVDDILKADKLVLPGIGHFRKGMEYLKQLGFIDVLNKKVLEEKTPILGICLGMQLLTKYSEEGNTQGLGWVDAKTIKFNFNRSLRIPHMGWNNIKFSKMNPIIDGVKDNGQFYFVHSYFVECNDERDKLSTTVYGKKFDSAIQKENIFGMQFHPEKSHDLGLCLLKNFAEKI